MLANQPVTLLTVSSWIDQANNIFTFKYPSKPSKLSRLNNSRALKLEPLNELQPLLMLLSKYTCACLL